MFNPSRDDVRTFMFETWRKYRAGSGLHGAEIVLLPIILEHPEYHAVLEDPDTYAARTWHPEGGETNPFMHLSFHLALAEQRAIDQPPGIRAAWTALAEKLGEPHEADHAVLDCLLEQLWKTQRHGTSFDVQAYLEAVRRLI
jgi:hypothetical protein